MLPQDGTLNETNLLVSAPRSPTWWHILHFFSQNKRAFSQTCQKVTSNQIHFIVHIQYHVYHARLSTTIEFAINVNRRTNFGNNRFRVELVRKHVRKRINKCLTFHRRCQSSQCLFGTTIFLRSTGVHLSNAFEGVAAHT